MTIQEYIEIYIETINKRSKEFLPMQPGDVPDTYAVVDQLIKDVHYKPETSVKDGIRRFVAWYREYYGVEG